EQANENTTVIRLFFSKRAIIPLWIKGCSNFLLNFKKLSDDSEKQSLSSIRLERSRCFGINP
ncbi:hypothetical protein, partial [Marinilabilia rubra]|uniref:hypothetical protein n=1 Tax=Marinilabilia rubra TaxID=2162893 RepID=UPI001E3E5EB5